MTYADIQIKIENMLSVIQYHSFATFAKRNKQALAQIAWRFAVRVGKLFPPPVNIMVKTSIYCPGKYYDFSSCEKFIINNINISTKQSLKMLKLISK